MKLAITDFGEQAIRSLQLLLKLSPAVASSLCDQITTGASKLLHSHPPLLRYFLYHLPILCVFEYMHSV